MDAIHPADRLESLDQQQCLDLLGAGEIGRLGFVVDGQPRIEPVNYRLVGSDVIFVSRPGAKLDAAIHGQRVAFEIDAVEEWAQSGWSVLLVGVARVVGDPVELAALAPSRPRAWAPTTDVALVRVVATAVTGRRVRIGPGGVSVLHQDVPTED